MLIRNVDDLHSQIARLSFLKQQQKAAIGERFNSPSAVFLTALSIFPKSSATNNLKSQDIFGLLSRIVLPFALNKTLFRHSNFIVKALVGFASQKASRFISEESVAGVWDKAKGIFDKFTKKDKPAKPKNLQGYGVPQL
jgi:hypothetical protein